MQVQGLGFEGKGRGVQGTEFKVQG